MSLPSDKETSSARPVEVLSPVNTAFPNSKVGSSPKPPISPGAKSNPSRG